MARIFFDGKGPGQSGEALIDHCVAATGQTWLKTTEAETQRG
jgi:hypothetical protein